MITPIYSALWCYQLLLSVNDKVLMDFVDLYNAGQLSKNWAFALEVIDGCDGLGDSVVIQ